MLSHVKVHSLTTYHIVLAKFGELPIKLYIFMLMWVFNTGLPTYPPLGKLVMQPCFPDILSNKGLIINTNQQPCGRHHGDYLIGKHMTTQ